jgi:hypothetical protein
MGQWCCLLKKHADTFRTHLRYARRTATSCDAFRHTSRARHDRVDRRNPCKEGATVVWVGERATPSHSGEVVIGRPACLTAARAAGTTRSAIEDIFAGLSASIIGRFVKPEDEASAVLFGASDQATAIAAATLPIDGVMVRVIVEPSLRRRFPCAGRRVERAPAPRALPPSSPSSSDPPSREGLPLRRRPQGVKDNATARQEVAPPRRLLIAGAAVPVVIAMF